MQAQIQILLAGGAEGIGRGGERFHREVAKLPVFSEEVGKVSGFVTAYKLYIKARLMGAIAEEQV